MNIHFLGTGSAYPGAEKDNTSLCLSHGEQHILIDVSGNPCKKLKQLSIELYQVKAIIFTHFHIDHIYGLPSLLWGMWLEGRKEPLTIYVDYRNEEKLQQWLHTMDIERWGIEFQIHVETFDGDKLETIYKIEGMNIACFPAIHSVPTIGLEIMYFDKKIIFSGDSEINQHILSYDSIELLIHEATFASTRADFHTCLEEIREAYDLRKIKEVVAVHLSDSEPYEQVANTFPKRKLLVAEDMMTITL